MGYANAEENLDHLGWIHMAALAGFVENAGSIYGLYGFNILGGL